MSCTRSQTCDRKIIEARIVTHPSELKLSRQTCLPWHGASVVPLPVNNHLGSSRSRGSGLLCKEPPQCLSLLAVGHWSLRSERPKYVFRLFAQSSMLTSEPGIARQRLCSPPEAFPLDPRVSLCQSAQDRMSTSLEITK